MDCGTAENCLATLVIAITSLPDTSSRPIMEAAALIGSMTLIKVVGKKFQKIFLPVEDDRIIS